MFDGPPAPLDALCDAHAAMADERKITKTSELLAICDPPKEMDVCGLAQHSNPLFR
jgi:hypothetical protein